MLVNQTPFYGESGGQVGDVDGELGWWFMRSPILNAFHQEFLSIIFILILARWWDRMRLQIDVARRLRCEPTIQQLTMYEALRLVLGDCCRVGCPDACALIFLTRKRYQMNWIRCSKL